MNIIIISPKGAPTDILVDQLSELLGECMGDPTFSGSDSETTKTLSWIKEFPANYSLSGLQRIFNSRVKDSEIIFIDLKSQDNTWRNVSILLNIIGVAVAVIALITGTVKT